MQKTIDLSLPRKVYADGVRVVAEVDDDRLIVMTAEVALTLGKLLSDAGADALIAKYGGRSTSGK